MQVFQNEIIGGRSFVSTVCLVAANSPTTLWRTAIARLHSARAWHRSSAITLNATPGINFPLEPSKRLRMRLLPEGRRKQWSRGTEGVYRKYYNENTSGNGFAAKVRARQRCTRKVRIRSRGSGLLYCSSCRDLRNTARRCYPIDKFRVLLVGRSLGKQICRRWGYCEQELNRAHIRTTW